MRLLRRTCLPILLLLASAVTMAQTLVVGDKAPPISVTKWIKGAPITSLDAGLFVIEFWATWSAPCLHTIPLVASLAKKFDGKAKFIGMSVWEEKDPDGEPYLQKVEQFVGKMGDKMAYTVAFDSPDHAMATNWMIAAGQNSIPTAFVVRDGRIAWIGHPTMGLEAAIEQMIAGTYNLEAARREFLQKAKEKREMALLLEKTNKALAHEDISRALVELDRVLAARPDLSKTLALTKFGLLLKFDEKAAYGFALTAGRGFAKDDPMILNSMAWALVEDENGLIKPDLRLAAELASRAVDLTSGKDPYILDTLAYAQFKLGEYKKALINQEKAVALATAQGDTFPAETLKDLQQRLERFRKIADGD